MKKGFRILFALVALLGVMNCFLLEPALAVQHETVCASDDGCDDCFVCCAFNHQLLPSTKIELTPISFVASFIQEKSAVNFDSPAFPIFHPPLAV